MHRRLSVLTFGLILLLFATLGVLDLATNEANAQPMATPSDCVAEALKSADPAVLPLGQDTGVTLVVSGTCGAQPLPVDIVIVADESNSMTEGRTTGPGPTDRPDPGMTGTPTREPPPFPTAGGDQPSFCGGGGPAPRPSPTPTRQFQWRTPTPGPPTPTPVLEQPGTEDLIRAQQQWVRDFLDQTVIARDFANGRLHMGFVSFNERAIIRQPLSDDPSDVQSSGGRLRGGNITRINTGVTEAERIISGAGSRPDDARTKVIILLSDFEVCLRDMAGGGGGRNPSKYVTVGMGRDFNRKNALDMATQQEFALEQNDIKELIELYERVLTGVTGLTVQQVVVSDTLAANMELVPDSAVPPANIVGQQLQWLVDVPVFPASFFYRVRPLDPGVHPISDAAEADWTDSAGRTGQVAFPNVDVEVIPPTSTPTPTAEATPTATGTATPKDLYLPIAFRLWPEAVPTATPCVPEEQHLDVAFVIDTSTSMSDPTHLGGQPKLTAAIEAAVAFVSLLKATDQAAVVGFNSTTTVAAALTSDRVALTAALRSLPSTQAIGTGIDLGLLTGLEELNKTTRTPDTRSIVLVTDGIQSSEGGAQAVRDAAAAVKGAGIRLVTVGLGSSSDIDEALLREIATSPALYFPAPNAADLERIYREIVHLIPCQ